MPCSKGENMHKAAQSSFCQFNRVDIFSEFILEDGIHSCHRRIIVRGIVELEITNLLADTVFFDYIKEAFGDVLSAVFTDNLHKADESSADLARSMTPMRNDAKVCTIARRTGPKIQ